MKHYKYYTPEDLAIEILKLLKGEAFETAIDICCGSWNLLKAANKVLGCKKLYGVDIDEDVAQYRTEKGRVYIEDGRNYALRTYKRKKYDLVLSNPPFGWLKDNERVMLENVKSAEYENILNKRYENEMILANMLLVKNNGFLVAILPNTFVYGKTNKKVRVEIAKTFHVNSIIDLPQGTFKTYDLSAVAIILQKKKCDEETMLYKATFDNGWNIAYKTRINPRNVSAGVWQENNNLFMPFSKDNIFRGVISSNMFSEEGFNEVYHCSSNFDEKGNWQPSVRRCNNEHSEKLKYAELNDIIINRVGKCAGYWTVNQSKKTLISDCIFVLRGNCDYYKKQLEAQSIEGRLNIPLRGVSTKYITVEDVMQLIQ